jgi:ATP-binding cassette, subfamily B, bacterial MsbA
VRIEDQLKMKLLLRGVFALKAERLYVVILVVLSLLLAFTEGVSISMLIPVLDSSAMSGVLGSVPGFKLFGDWLQGFPESQRLMIVTVILAAAITLRGIVQLGSQYLASLIPLRVQCAIMQRTYDALVDADMAYMPAHSRGELYAILREHPLRAASVVNGILSFIIAFCLIVVFGGLMLVVSLPMTLASGAFVVVAYVVMKAIGKPWFAWAGERLSRVLSELSAGIVETTQGLELIKLRGAERFMKRRFAAIVDDFSYVEVRRIFFTELQSPATNTMSGLFICLLLVVAMSVYGSDDRSWTSLFVFFILCLYRLIGPASRLISAQGIIAANLDAFVASEAFVRVAASSRLANGSMPFNGLKESIRFEQVSLVYDEDRGFVLSDVNLEVRNGEVVALVGASGAGKSSILALLMRLRDPTSGKVVVDGADLRDYDISSWRRSIASVSQEIVLFNDSVRRNLCFGIQDMPDELLWAALREAAAEEFVRDMPGMLDAQLGDAGRNLSGGQRQRLALARALIANPQLLVLDEATSQLDGITERSIQKAVERSRGHRSVIVVAHRLSTVRNADRIYVLEGGHIVEQGTHDELYALQGQYRRLFETQQRSESVNESVSAPV